MPAKKRRMTVNILPECEPALMRLKKEIFYNHSRSEMLRYVITVGLNSLAVSKKEMDEGPKV